jgi:hypothetical protein
MLNNLVLDNKRFKTIIRPKSSVVETRTNKLMRGFKGFKKRKIVNDSHLIVRKIRPIEVITSTVHSIPLVNKMNAI